MSELLDKLLSDDAVMDGGFVKEMVDTYFSEQLVHRAEKPFYDSVAKIMGTSVPVLRRFAMDEATRSCAVASGEIPVVEEIVAGQDVIKAIDKRLGSNAETICAYCFVQDNALGISNQEVVAGHVFLQNEFVAALGDRAKGAERALEKDLIGQKALINFESMKRYAENEQDLEAHRALMDIYKRWLHLVCREHPHAGDQVRAVWRVLASDRNPAALDEVTFPSGEETTWRGYAVGKSFPCRHETDHVVEMSIHFHPGISLYGSSSLWHVLVYDDGRKGTAFNLGNDASENGVDIQGLNFEQLEELAHALSLVPFDQRNMIFETYRAPC